MDQPDREVEPNFSHPVRQIILMLVVLGLTVFGVFLALPRVLPVFQANPYLNGFIIFVFVIGVLACFWQMFQLIGSVRWLEGFAAQTPGHEMTKAPQLLAPLATLLRQRAKRMQIAQTSARSILDSVAQRIDEAREITRYIVNMLIFLGLLGTFYGLATTVPALVDTIRGLAPQEGEDGVEVFSRLMTGLEGQLGGMGVAFASSLLGLAGSLVVGLLELFASHGQNRFYRELEEWLSTITRVGYAGSEGEGAGGSDAMGGVLDHMNAQMDGLQSLMERSEQARIAADTRMAQLATAVEHLASRMGTTDNDILARIADGQERLVDVLGAREANDGLDAESRMRLRSIDVQMLRILEEISAGRQESMTELRTDLATLTRALERAKAGR
ncbi:biopolymer transporter ExbB [Roseovarius sp. LXJ103]|uniref:biopolymer transporter ExbB n=1 Tax=Roseovarius carneus TaxID=2853164 RepID=UPI000D60EF4F|nr:biopolymer transporter ExbB [Roseovarius carneus]MBZ8118098.1 biopolymer transporter ExbB [Roseovarius carneus]PWE36162.1 biopolymer transporter ExbB [Pelagicola sp. LXJ1103]